MNNAKELKKTNRLYQFMIVFGIIVVAANLRPAITSIGPLVGTIRDDLGLSNGSMGLLTSLPLILFALVSPIVPRFANKYTNELILLSGLIILLIGIVLRSFSIIATLFLGTFFLGAGIAICNVLLPGIIKEKFPRKVGLMTSVYSTTMGIFAAIGSGLSIPLAKGLGLGWPSALLIWGIPTLIAGAVWIFILRKTKSENDVELNYGNSEGNQIWKSGIAWQVAFYMGFQSFLFYVTISWLPEILHSQGISISAAGWLLFATQMIGLPFSFIVPLIAEKLPSQRLIVFALGLCSISGYGFLLFGTSPLTMILSIVFIGITLGGTFPLALTLLSMRARSARQAAALSGMAQSIGYILAATGPMVIGYLYDLTSSWTMPIVILLIVAVFVVIFGMGAGRNKYVFD